MRHPLSAAAKEEMRLDLLSHSSGRKKSPLSDQIQSASARTCDSQAELDSPTKTLDPER